MELYRPRSSSIPQEDRFSLTDAVHLKLTLQALDHALSNLPPHSPDTIDLKHIIDACQPRPFHEEVYVDGSEEFYLVVKSLSRPDLIPDVYVQAYVAALQGRAYVNEFRVSDFKKGVDPTFSQIRVLLQDIDRVCDTNLEAAYQDVERNVQPFPFLRLPAELRIHVYSHLLPRESHIALLFQPTRDHNPPRIHLDVMRVNRQVNAETTQHLYEKRALFMIAARDKSSINLSNEFTARYYEVLANMSLQTRKLFKTLDVQASYLAHQEFLAKRYLNIPYVSDPIKHMFALLPNLETLVISLGTPSHFKRTFQQRSDTITWLVDHVPPTVNIVWDLTHAWLLQGLLSEQPLWQTIQARGLKQPGASVTTRLIGSGKSFWAIKV